MTVLLEPPLLLDEADEPVALEPVLVEPVVLPLLEVVEIEVDVVLTVEVVAGPEVLSVPPVDELESTPPLRPQAASVRATNTAAVRAMDFLRDDAGDGISRRA